MAPLGFSGGIEAFQNVRPMSQASVLVMMTQKSLKTSVLVKPSKQVQQYTHVYYTERRSYSRLFLFYSIFNCVQWRRSIMWVQFSLFIGTFLGQLCFCYLKKIFTALWQEGVRLVLFFLRWVYLQERGRFAAFERVPYLRQTDTGCSSWIANCCPTEWIGKW